MHETHPDARPRRAVRPGARPLSGWRRHRSAASHAAGSRSGGVGFCRNVPHLDGVRLANEVAVTGTPAVFVHGGPGSGSHAFRVLGDAAVEKHLRIAALMRDRFSRSFNNAMPGAPRDRRQTVVPSSFQAFAAVQHAVA